MSIKPKVISIVGATASGKTSLAITLAEAVDGEVISADSRQVYRGLDIGTAKATTEEMQGVPHHLIDIVDINTIYTAQDFVHDATAAITDITHRSKVPIVAGGTFFYIELLKGTMQAAPVAPNPTLRAELETHSTEQLHELLATQAPERAAAIDPHNRRRLIRALEIVAALGAVPSPTSTTDSPFDMLTIGIKREKEELLHRYQQRATAWLNGGFRHEVEQLLARGISRARLQEIGFEYTLMLDLIDGIYDESTFIEKCIQKNWQYAKRQLTWLKRDAHIHWYTPDQQTEVIEAVQAFLTK